MTLPTEALQRVSLFSRLPAPLLSSLGQRLVPRRYRRDQVIFHQGDAGIALYLIQSGQVKIVLISPEGDELLVTILGPGDFFGELALLDDRPRSATAVAMTDTQAFTLDRQEFLGLLMGSPEAAVAVSTVLAERLRRVDERLAENVFLDLPQRLGRSLLHLAETNGRKSPQGLVLDLPFSQRELGELLGATRQSIKRVLSQWEREGLVHREGRSLILLRPERLQAPLL